MDDNDYNLEDVNIIKHILNKTKKGKDISNIKNSNK